MSQSQTIRPEFFQLQNGSKANLPFSDAEYEARLGKLRSLMSRAGVDAVLLSSMHNIAYYSGFLYCSFGRPYACVVTEDRCVTVSANIDGGQPWRRCYGENVIYTDWQRNNYWRAVKSIILNAKHIGIEAEDVINFSETCTPAVAAAVPVAVQEVLEALDSLSGGSSE